MHVKKRIYWHDSLKLVKAELFPTSGCLSINPIGHTVQIYSLQLCSFTDSGDPHVSPQISLLNQSNNIRFWICCSLKTVTELALFREARSSALFALSRHLLSK